jgi:hypothetical protein
LVTEGEGNQKEYAVFYRPAHDPILAIRS